MQLGAASTEPQEYSRDVYYRNIPTSLPGSLYSYCIPTILIGFPVRFLGVPAKHGTRSMNYRMVSRGRGGVTAEERPLQVSAA